MLKVVPCFVSLPAGKASPTVAKRFYVPLKLTKYFYCYYLFNFIFIVACFKLVIFDLLAHKLVTSFLQHTSRHAALWLCARYPGRSAESLAQTLRLPWPQPREGIRAPTAHQGLCVLNMLAAQRLKIAGFEQIME